MDSITILDVGHGNSTVICSDDDITVIDAPQRASLLDYLDQRPTERVHRVLASHADDDHIAGVTALLTSHRVHIEEVYANADSPRKTTAWRHFKKALKLIRRETVLYPSLTSTTPGVLEEGDFVLEVVSPSPHMALDGVGVDRQTSNTLSAAIRIVRDGRGQVLCTADIDALAWSNLMEEEPRPELSARVLVFPHHGGRPGPDVNAREFAREVTEIVDPEFVVFSIARRYRWKNPRKDVVFGVRQAASEAHIACTQMSRHCTASDDDLPGGNGCAGSVVLTFPGGEISPGIGTHDSLILAKADPSKALCRIPVDEPAAPQSLRYSGPAPLG
jgi:beta-lactamase superfamily II metal-dependent hydrolase